jgi:hypothetical protein
VKHIQRAAAGFVAAAPFFLLPIGREKLPNPVDRGARRRRVGLAARRHVPSLFCIGDPARSIAIILEAGCALQVVFVRIHNQRKVLIVLVGDSNSLERNRNILLSGAQNPPTPMISEVTFPDLSRSTSMTSPILLLFES